MIAKTDCEHQEPLFLSCSEVDHTFDLPSRRKALDILQAGQKTWQLQLFSGVEHGFALRGDPKDPYQRESSCTYNYILVLTSCFLGYVKEQSLKGIVGWFDFWLSQ